MFDAEKEAMKGELTMAAAEAAANNSPSGQSGSNQNSNGDETLNSTNPLGNGSTTTAYPNTPQGGRTNSNIKGYDPTQYAGNVQAGSQGYYVTAGVFGARNNAAKLQNKLRSQGVGADVFQDPSNNMFYVFLLKFNNYESAKQARESGFNGQYGGKLWIKVL